MFIILYIPSRIENLDRTEYQNCSFFFFIVNYIFNLFSLLTLFCSPSLSWLRIIYTLLFSFYISFVNNVSPKKQIVVVLDVRKLLKYSCAVWLYLYLLVNKVLRSWLCARGSLFHNFIITLKITYIKNIFSTPVSIPVTWVYKLICFYFFYFFFLVYLLCLKIYFNAKIKCDWYSIIKDAL